MIRSNLFCPRCGDYGQLRFLYCSENTRVFLYCHECDAYWMDPPEFQVELSSRFYDKNQKIILDRDLVIPGIGCPYSKIRYATLDEIIAFGWEKYIQNNEHG